MILKQLFILGFWLGILNCKALIKNISSELMPITWHPIRWLNFSILEDHKKEIEPNFTE